MSECAAKTFETVFTEVILARLEGEIETVEPFEPSADFDERMDKLLAGEAPKRRTPMKKTWRIVLIAAAILALLALTACVIAKIIKTNAGFSYEQHSNYGIILSSATRESIDDEYSITYVPEGFYKDSSSTSVSRHVEEYKKDDNGFNDEGAVIALSQYIRGVEPRFDTDVDYYDKDIGDINVYMHVEDYGGHAFWVHDGYLFLFYIIDYYPTDEQLMIDVISSIKKTG